MHYNYNIMNFIYDFEKNVANISKQDENAIYAMRNTYFEFLNLHSHRNLKELCEKVGLNLFNFTEFILLAKVPMMELINFEISILEKQKKHALVQQLEKKLFDVGTEALINEKNELNENFSLSNPMKNYEENFMKLFVFFREMKNSEKAQDLYVEIRNFIAQNPLVSKNQAMKFIDAVGNKIDFDLLLYCEEKRIKKFTFKEWFLDFYSEVDSDELKNRKLCNYCKEEVDLIDPRNKHDIKSPSCKGKGLLKPSFFKQREYLVASKQVYISIVKPTMFEIELEQRLSKRLPLTLSEKFENKNTEPRGFFEIVYYPNLERSGDISVNYVCNTTKQILKTVNIDAKTYSKANKLISDLLKDSKIGGIDIICVPKYLYDDGKNSTIDTKRRWNFVKKNEKTYPQLINKIKRDKKIVSDVYDLFEKSGVL